MPPPTLVATAGATNANAYATLAEANAYHEAHAHGSAWRTALVETRQRALLTATRLIDQHFVWSGYPTTSAQVLAWPRGGLRDPNGNTLDSGSIPTRVKEATCEFARQLLAEDRTADSEIEAKGLRSLTVGSIAMTFDGAVRGKVIPDAVWYLLALWGEPTQRQGDGPISLARV